MGKREFAAKIENKEDMKLPEQIHEAFRIDQFIREKAVAGDQLFGVLSYLLDRLHHQTIKEWIEKYGQFSLDEESMEMFRVLVAHQHRDRQLMESCLDWFDFSPAQKQLLAVQIESIKSAEEKGGAENVDTLQK